jgi:hypothetical protein
MGPSYTVSHENGVLVDGIHIAPRVISSLMTTVHVLRERRGSTPRTGNLATVFVCQGRRSDNRRRDVDASHGPDVAEMSEVVLGYLFVIDLWRLQ